jgi:hypothetical protein
MCVVACTSPDIAYVDGSGTGDCSLAAPCPTIAQALGTGAVGISVHGSIDERVVIDRSVYVVGPALLVRSDASGPVVTIRGASVQIASLTIVAKPGQGAVFAAPSSASTASISDSEVIGGSVEMSVGSLAINGSRFVSASVSAIRDTTLVIYGNTLLYSRLVVRVKPSAHDLASRNVLIDSSIDCVAGPEFSVADNVLAGNSAITGTCGVQ